MLCTVVTEWVYREVPGLIRPYFDNPALRMCKPLVMATSSPQNDAFLSAAKALVAMSLALGIAGIFQIFILRQSRKVKARASQLTQFRRRDARTADPSRQTVRAHFPARFVQRTPRCIRRSPLSLFARPDSQTITARRPRRHPCRAHYARGVHSDESLGAYAFAQVRSPYISYTPIAPAKNKSCSAGSAPPSPLSVLVSLPVFKLLALSHISTSTNSFPVRNDWEDHSGPPSAAGSPEGGKDCARHRRIWCRDPRNVHRPTGAVPVSLPSALISLTHTFSTSRRQSRRYSRALFFLIGILPCHQEPAPARTPEHEHDGPHLTFRR